MVRAKNARMILFQLGQVECRKSHDEIKFHREAGADPHDLQGRKDDKYDVDCVTPVIEKLTEWRRSTGPSGLFAVDGVQCLVREQAQSRNNVAYWWKTFRERMIERKIH